MLMASGASEVTSSGGARQSARAPNGLAESDAPSSLAPESERGSLPVIARYELLSELASGGMATVYVGRARGTIGFEHLVAIKTLHPHLRNQRSLVEMFLDEARLAGRIDHPNVVAALESGRDAHGHPFIAMQYVAGEQLGALLRGAGESGKRIAPQIVLRIVLDVLAGLQAAHALRDDNGRSIGLVHRDVSPQNILVGQDGCARLTDFGVAKAEGRLHATRADVVKGKLAYMAPEQAAGRTLDQRTDLFAMGIVLWEALTRRRLFAAEDSSEVFRRVLYDPIPRPSSVHASLAPLDSLLDRALARDPDQRFATAQEFARAIEHAALTIGGVAPHTVVAKLVARLAREKLEGERARMQSAAAFIEQDTDERSETRKLTRADGIGREPVELVEPASLVSTRPAGWRGFLREMTLPRWAGVATALLLGALCTALFPAPTARSGDALVSDTAPARRGGAASPSVPSAASIPVPVAAPVVRPTVPAGTAVGTPTQMPSAVPAAAPEPAAPVAARLRAALTYPRSRQLKRAAPGPGRIPNRPGGNR